MKHKFDGETGGNVGTLSMRFGKCTCCDEKYFELKCGLVPLDQVEKVVAAIRNGCASYVAEGEARSRLDNKMHN